jgi:ABC-type transporter Mla subunit MlaD
MVGIIKRAAGAFTFGRRLNKARKEVEDVIALTQKLLDKYEDVDEDARRLKIELSEAVASLKAVMKF